jgi:penicillin-binding protein 1C
VTRRAGLAAGLVLLAAALSAAALDPDASLRLEDRYGNALRSFRSERETVCQPVPLARVSPWMVLATLAAEDKRFWQHAGVDMEALLRSAALDLRAGRAVSGASTLSQQLARYLEPRPRTLWGKLKEAVGARRLEKEHGKGPILEAYLNSGSYGAPYQGVEAASQAYFGVSAAQLSLAQAALLAGVPKAPAHYEPLKHRKQAQRRQAWVLGRVEAEGWATPEELALARQERLVLRAPKAAFRAPHFCDAVRRWRPQAQGVLRTTLDGPLQEDLEALLRAHLARLRSQRVTQAALLVLENKTGEVLAWVGSADWYGGASGQVDGVLALRQPGSALKPFLYALGFSQGLHASMLVDDAPYTNAGGFSPRNYDRGYHGRVSLRQALACSYNIPAVKLIEQLSVEEAYRVDRRFGLRSLDQGAAHYGPGLALGDGEVNLLELATAYAALARGGLWRPASLTLEREPLRRPDLPGHRAMDAASCFQVLDVLADNSARRAAFGPDSVLRLPFDAAAKTGTTKDYRDNWCVGVTPEWTVAVWAGNHDAAPMRRVSGISGAGPLFHDAAMRVARDRPPSPFPVPAGLQHLRLDRATGRRDPGDGRATVEEWVQERFMDRLDGEGVALLDPQGPAVPGGARISFPRPGQVFVLDPQATREEQSIRPRCSGAAAQGLRWSLDGQALESPAPWIGLKKGQHHLAVQWPGGNDAVDFLVLD